MVQKPDIETPNGGVSFSSNQALQTLSGKVFGAIDEVTVNGSSAGVVLDLLTGKWAKQVTLEFGINILQVVARSGVELSEPAVQAITLLEAEDLNISVTSPTGIVLNRLQDALELTWVNNPEAEVSGYNVYFALAAGGGRDGYSRLNTDVISVPKQAIEERREISRKEEFAGNLVRTVIDEELTDREIFNILVKQLPNGDPVTGVRVFFVITAVAFDATLNEEIESVFSDEIAGEPVTIGPFVRDIVGKTVSDIQLDLISAILQKQPNADVKPGEVFRDVTIDPPADEIRRAHKVLEFIGRANSLLTLQDLDDADKDGVSDAVEESPSKLELSDALRLTPDQTQTLIDEQFDKYAANVGLKRRKPGRAEGVVTFFLDSPPIEDVSIPVGSLVATKGDDRVGIEPVIYETLEAAATTPDDASSFFNPQSRRFEFRVRVRATLEGISGTQPTGTITQVLSGPTRGVKVVNADPILGGSDLQTNQSLLEQILAQLTGVDSGTRNGYRRVLLAIPGILKIRVVDAGDPFMVRDFDEVRHKHIGGKVDLYILGELPTVVQQRAAFSFTTITEEAGIESVLGFRFRVLNPDVSITSPVFEVTQVRNLSRAADYDLTGMVILNGITLDLDENNPTNLAIGLDNLDEVQITYKFRRTLHIELSGKPFKKLLTATGSQSGDLLVNSKIIRNDDPLIFGTSFKEKVFYEAVFADGKPVGDLEDVDEDVVLDAEFPTFLGSLGVLPGSIQVLSLDESIIYIEGVDFTVALGDETTQTTIQRTSTSTIPDGATVTVKYRTGEQITVEYAVNGLVEIAQDRVEEFRHICADALVKEADLTPVDIAMRIHLRVGFSTVDVKRQISTKIANFLNGRSIGESIHQSDIIGVAEGVRGVDFVEIPLAKLVRADGDLILHEPLESPVWEVFRVAQVTSFITSVPVLEFKTTVNGGRTRIDPSGFTILDPVKVIQDEFIDLELIDDPLETAAAAGRAHIQADGRVIVSVPDGTDPTLHGYEVNYVVLGESGAKDIIAKSLETIRLNSLNVEVVI